MTSVPGRLLTGASVVIVGAGMAGLAVAAELERRGHTDFLLLEAGPDRGFGHYRTVLDPATALQYWLRPEVDPDFWRPYEQGDASFGGLAGLRRRTGGRSLYWHGITLPIESWALREPDWPVDVVRDLTHGFGGGPPLYERTIEQLAQWVGRPTLHMTTARLGNYILHEAPESVRVESDGTRRVFSPLEHWRGDGRVPPVVNDVPALGLIADGSGITGVRVSTAGSDTYDVPARAVVLAAGTTENTRLVLQLRGKAEDGSLRMPGLSDKVVHGFSAVLDRADVPPWLANAAARSVLFVAAAPDPLRSNLFLRTFTTDHGDCGVDAWLMGEQRPDEYSGVSCTSTEQWPWPTKVTCSLSATDLVLADYQRRELDAVRDALAQAAHVALDSLVFDEFGSADLPKRLTAAQSACPSSATLTYSFPLGSEQHESGTLPLGSVLNAQQGLRGVDRLYVHGACVFPRSGAANPSLTILALAARLADHLVTAVGRPA